MASLGLIAVLVLTLAWANGANDVSKGVATLTGSGVSQARRALMWGTLWTVLGGMAAVLWGSQLVDTFSKGFLAPGIHFDQLFLAASMIGALCWILLATRFGLPVSTTHALLGGVVGAALIMTGPAGIRAAAMANKALLPLLISPLIAIFLCGALVLAIRFATRNVPQWRPGCCRVETWQRNPYACAPDGQRLPPSQMKEKLWIALHWLSSGATSFARALNDVPKIAAFLIVAVSLAPESIPPILNNHPSWPILAVTLVMMLGSLWGGAKVLEVLAYRVTPMDSLSGLTANLSTSIVVLLASPLGLPVSTTHVSIGSLMGIRWAGEGKPNQGDALKLVLFGWLITFPVAGAIAGIAAVAGKLF